MRPVVFILLAVWIFSVEKSMALSPDSAYVERDFQLAVKGFEEKCQQYPCAENYYNLANAYYRLDNLGKAILNYERALKYAPCDKDIQFNLELCETKVIHRVEEPAEMFFVTFVKKLRDLFPAIGWGKLSYVFLSLCLVLLLLMKVIWGGKFRKISTVFLFFSVVAFLLSLVLAVWKNHIEQNDNSAIVIHTCEASKSSRLDAEKTGKLHPGLKVELTGLNAGGLVEVKLLDGTICWVSETDVEKIVNNK